MTISLRAWILVDYLPDARVANWMPWLVESSVGASHETQGFDLTVDETVPKLGGRG